MRHAYRRSSPARSASRNVSTPRRCSSATPELSPQMEGWQSWHRQGSDGAIESEQRVGLTRPVVEFSAAGAERLGHSYWREVRRVTGSLVRPRERAGALELRLLGGPVLLRFDRPTIEAGGTPALFRHPIARGVLAPPAAPARPLPADPAAPPPPR